MVKRSEWRHNVWRAWTDEPCAKCGRSMPEVHIDDDGKVWAYCTICNREEYLANEPIPTRFDPEEYPDDLPF